jgi:hypothetical protein
MKVTQPGERKRLAFQGDNGAHEDQNTGMPAVAPRRDGGASAYGSSDGIKALELMLKYGLGPRTEHEIRTTASLDASPEEQEELLRRALRDPGVRQWLEETHPEALEQWRIMVAKEPIEEVDEADFELIEENSTSVPPRQGRYENETGGVRVGTNSNGGETR